MTTYPCGYRSLRLEDAARARPVAIDVWYPSPSTGSETPHDYGLGAGRVVEGAPAIDEALPVIVLSHGAFGSARNYSWIAESLARNGYLVCGVSHFGESPVYGVETIDPSTVLDPSDRVVDCSFALDHVLAGALLEHVDPWRVGALGHSSGGATAIALAGGLFDPAAMARHCASEKAAEDRGCAYGRLPAAALRRPPAPRSHHDPRVRAVVALDPALGPGFDAGSLSEISIPVHVVGAVDNDFLPVDAHAGRYVGLIPGCSFTRLSGGEGHFVYLNECDSDLDANGVPLCRDRPGVDRRAVHASLEPLIRAFFDANL
ncbi:MAG: alpha/beta hydrolase family protein [Actinomycetota bacterium]